MGDNMGPEAFSSRDRDGSAVLSTNAGRPAHGAGPDGGRAYCRPSAEPIARLQALRTALLDAPYSLCTQKAELLTEYFRRTEPGSLPLRALVACHFGVMRRILAENLASGRPQGRIRIRVGRALQRIYRRATKGREPAGVRFARALEYVLAHQRLRVYDHELIVGNLSGHRIGAPIHPDYGGLLLLPELGTLGTRPTNALQVSAEQIRRLERDVFPYWFPRSVLANAPLFARDPELQNTLTRGRDYVLTQFAGISHVTPDYPSVLEKGFEGILTDVEAASRDARDEEARAFYRAAAVVARAAIAFGRRWSRHVAARAEHEDDQARRAELTELSEILARVPAQPARTFHEALQSLFLTHVIVHQESFQHGVSFGRIDRYLVPYYRRDVDAGRLTPDRAVELLGCFLAKAAEQLPLFNSMATEFFSGLSSASGLTIGGVDGDGRDAATEVSYLILEAYDRMRLRQPNLHLRVHPDSPPELVSLAYEVLKRGGGMPALFNDETIVPALESIGVERADARDYSIVGCVEWGVPYRSFPAAGAAFVSLPAVLDDVLHGDAVGDRVTPSSGSMEELFSAFVVMLARRLDAAADGNDAIEAAHRECRPTPLLSLLVGGCIETGRDVTAGGARYDSSGMQGVGLADVADSLAAIERLVFVEKRMSLGELMAAVDADFAGHDVLRARLRTRLGRYGRDDGAAEIWAARVARAYCALVRGHRNPRGGAYAPGFWSMTTHIGFGSRLRALPSGRLAGEPLADGVSPANGADDRGPTASLMAACRACGPDVGNGLALNEKLDPWFVQGERGTRLMDGLTRGYFAAGGMQVQYNIIDAAVLRDAKAHPERYRDLVVRISGYSAYFNDLTEEMKDDIIARTSHGANTPPPACSTPGGRDA
jgi:formate C-acetyltransferase